MNNDYIIRELRDTRKKIEEDCQKKGQSYFDHLLEVQEKYKDRIVTDTLDSQDKKKKFA
ncbi:MAG: hypothetical protein ACM3SY_10955 [Candidatus Omnitrophota bacterium]